MYCIIPLAGPDFFNEKYGYKPLVETGGNPLIEAALESRCWYRNKEVTDDKIIFVLRDEKKYIEFEEYLKKRFVGCNIVKISAFTKGALLSAMAGASLIEDFHEPIVVDLIDIIYETEFSPTYMFKKDINLGGIIPYFTSNNEKYSYLEIVDGYVTQTVEKRVISHNASAGTYFFRNLNVFMSAVAGSIKYDRVISYNGNLFLCPSFNFVERLIVSGVEVRVNNEISLQFH